jgi:hypothetical protein
LSRQARLAESKRRRTSRTGAHSLLWNVGHGFWNSGGTPSGEGDTEPLYWFRTIKKQCRTRLLVKFEGDDVCGLQLWASRWY